MPVRLIPLTAGSAPTVTLQRPVLLIGRHLECDVRLEMPQVSRRHCCVAQASNRLMIRDLGSRNGVRVNGRRVEEAELQPGDEIAIAHVLYRLEGLDTAMSGPAPGANHSKSPPEGPGDLLDLLDDDDGVDIDLIPLDDD